VLFSLKKSYLILEVLMLSYLERNLTELLLVVLLVPLRGIMLLLLSLMQGGGFALVYENCRFNGHSIDGCFKIIGYPADFGKKKSGQNFKGKNISNNNSVRTSSSSGFTNEQMATLISLIKDNKIGKKVQVNMAETIQHMTYTDKELDNVLDISHLKIKVGLVQARDRQVLEAQVKELDITEENVILEWGSKQESKYSEEDQLDDEEKDDKKGDVDDEGYVHISDTKDADDEDDETESDEDEIYKYKILVRKDEDEEMLDAEAEDSKKGDTEVSNVAKADAQKTKEVKDDSKKAKLPPTSSNLSIYSGFGDQFLKLSYDTSLVGAVKDTTDAEISSLLDIKIQSEVPHIQSPFVLRVQVYVISEPTVLTPVQETSSAALITTLPLLSVSTTPPAPQQTTTPILTPPIKIDAPTITTAIPESDALFAVQLRVAKLEKDLFELKTLGDALQKALQKHSKDLIQKHYVKPTPDSSKIKIPTINLEKGSKKSASVILKIKREQAEKQKTLKFKIKSIDKATLKECDQKSVLYQTMHANKSFNKNPANHKLYHALIEALIEDENAMDKGVSNTVKDHKRKHDDDEDDDDEDPLVGPNQGKKTKRRRTKELESSKKSSTTKVTPKGKASSKGSKSGKSASTKEPVDEPTFEVVMDNAGEDVVRNDDQPQDTSKPKIAKTLNPEWFTQPPRPPTPDPKWNKRQVVLDQPEQPCFILFFYFQEKTHPRIFAFLLRVCITLATSF
nr:ribonuclease H-like domain-containing protein [Tanacetum cinerariifolium]